MLADAPEVHHFMLRSRLQPEQWATYRKLAGSLAGISMQLREGIPLLGAHAGEASVAAAISALVVACHLRSAVACVVPNRHALHAKVLEDGTTMRPGTRNTASPGVCCFRNCQLSFFISGVKLHIQARSSCRSREHRVSLPGAFLGGRWLL